MTNQGHAVEFRILGPLEARINGESIPLGGAKQRAVLAVLLLRAGEVVSVEMLVDEVWGENPPPSAAHSVESYVSRLRQLFNGSGPAIVRRGAGYALELRGAVLDADVFVELHDDASHAAEGTAVQAVDLASAALAVWRGPALADVALASAGRAEAERLEELRLRTHEVRFDAELELGRHERVVSELQSLVRQNPYRERFVAQLMLALYRSGRHADALDVYERTRVALAEDLGLKPSVELQQLSGRVVRQDPQLRRPGLDDTTIRVRAARLPTRARRMGALVLAAALTAAVMAFTASGSAPTAHASAAAPEETRARVALVLPTDGLYLWEKQAFQTAGLSFDFETKIIDRVTAGMSKRIEDGSFDLVLVIGSGPTRALSHLVRETTDTRFVFIDASLAELSLVGAPNASAVRFADEQTSELAGYLSALVPQRDGTRTDRVDTVSVVAGPHPRQARRIAKRFARGVQQARGRAVAVRVAVVDDSNLATCERAANQQIDAGSDVVFVAAGHCGLGALAVARTRGVWGIGGYDAGISPGPHVLAVTYKDFRRAIGDVMSAYAIDDLRSGEDVVLGLNDDYAVGIDDTNLNPAVSESLWSKVVDRCSAIRVETAGSHT